MRLIDADKYKKQLCENCISKLKYGETFCPCGRVLDIDYFPTTYDVDKVVDNLIEKLGIAECRSCKFGGTYCVDCKFIDAHAILDALDDICTDNKSHHLVSQNDTKR